MGVIKVIDINTVLLVSIPLIIGGFAIGYSIRSRLSRNLIAAAEEEAKKIIDEGSSEASKGRSESLSKVHKEISRRRSDFELEDKEQRVLIQANEKRLQKKHEVLSQKQESLVEREEHLTEKEKILDETRGNIDKLICNKRYALEKLAEMTSEQARGVLLDKTVHEAKYDVGQRIKRDETEIRDSSNKIATEIISIAIQRCGGGFVEEPETPPVVIANDDMRQKLLGKDGKHIKLLQTLTGVEWTIDSERQVVVFTSPDSVKREIARLVGQKVLAEPRVHPHKIEEIYEKVRKEINAQIQEEAATAMAAAEVKGLHPELVRLLGRLKYRTSYGQNVLAHSVEVARLAGGMAAEIGANSTLARRAGLLHDIGKALDHEIEGSHVLIGVDYAKKYGESPQVIHCIAAHHGDEEIDSIEASLVMSSDTLSAGRPGARRETLESYIKRVEALESMASSFEGVDKAYAIHAGREIRVLVKPEKVSDSAAETLSKKVARRFEEELEYPGQIRVVVVRETRVVDYAR